MIDDALFPHEAALLQLLLSSFLTGAFLLQYNRCMCNIQCAPKKGSDDMHPFMRQISITYRCAMRFRERELADTGLAGCQTPYLTTLYRHPGISQEEMARALNVNKSSVTRQLAVLEDKGYIRREPSSTDKRILLVYPTEQALELKERLFRCYHDWNRYLTQDFTDEEQALLSKLMVRIAARAEDYVKGGDCACEPSENT